MKNLFKQLTLAFVSLFMLTLVASAQTSNSSKSSNSSDMKTYVIEREIPGVGAFTQAKLKEVSQASCSVLKQMDGIEWMHSYVTGNKIYCVYKAKNEELIREHAKRGGFPANSVSEVANVISPATAE